MEVTPEQVSAIKKSIRLGMVLQKEFPQIAEDYQNGMSTPKITKKYHFLDLYHFNDKIIYSAIRYAIRGSNGIYRTEAYEGLITDTSELARLCSEHRSENLKNSISNDQRKELGRKVYEEGKGIHSQSKSELSRIGRLGGARIRNDKLGIFSLSTEERRENSRKGTIAHGYIPWEEREKDFAYELSKNPEYQMNTKKGLRKNRVKIAKEINRVFHNNNPVRDYISVAGFFEYYRKIEGVWTNIRKKK